MRRIIALSAVLLVSACASTPQPQPTKPRPTPAVPAERGDLIGMTASELIQLFGTPTLQIREGSGLKLQFRANMCVLDAYLYPAPGIKGVAQVTHVDARLRSGADTSQASCIAALSRA